MEQEHITGSLLGAYRGLDLTDEKGLLCGRILADLGAQVIKIEPPQGDLARKTGPFYHDIPTPDRSLYWFACNVNKKGITLNIEANEGQELFMQLVSDADFVLESFSPGYLDKLGLGYSRLRDVNPHVVVTSITPFGHTGPYRDYKASDLTLMAMSGFMYMTGEPDRAPLRISCDQAYMHAAGEAAVATMTALYQRGESGEGQHIDVSVQASLIMNTGNAVPFWELNQVLLERAGHYRIGLMNSKQRQLWECQDGYVIFYIIGGAFGVKSNEALADWLESEGLADDFIRGMDWGSFDMATTTQKEQDHMEKLAAALFIRYTKAELYEQAIRRGLALCPVSTPQDILENPQLEARDYWVRIKHDELNGDFSYPGPFVKGSMAPCVYFRAPLIGEHNKEVYQDKLGLSDKNMAELRKAGVI